MSRTAHRAGGCFRPRPEARISGVVFLRRPLPRFLLWALVLVGVAVATGLGGLAWWWIVLIELAAWALVTLAERAISNRLRSTAGPRQWELTVAPAAAAPAEVVPTEQPRPSAGPNHAHAAAAACSCPLEHLVARACRPRASRVRGARLPRALAARVRRLRGSASGRLRRARAGVVRGPARRLSG